jgi:hypothetical protein
MNRVNLAVDGDIALETRDEVGGESEKRGYNHVDPIEK